MLTQVVPERQRPAFLAAAGLHDVDVVRVRPHGWPVEKRAYRIVLVRHMDVPEGEERGPIRFQGLQGGHAWISMTALAARPGTAVEPL